MSRSAPPRDAGFLSLRSPLFSLGFRPFYLLAAACAILGVGVWTAHVAGLMEAPDGVIAGVAWHGHEMVFGFALAVVAGFLFTAVRNWTGQPTPSGGALAGIAALWIAGRVLMVTGPPLLAAIVDSAFPVVIAAALWLPLQRSRNRNRYFVGLLLLVAGANAVFHAANAGVVPISPIAAVRAALFVIVMIVSIMAGRVIPSFTANAVRGARIRHRPWLDHAALGTGALAFVLLVAVPSRSVTGIVCLLAGGLHAVRALDWDPRCTRRVPILWILHLSYAWIPVGLLLEGWAALDGGVPVPLADHALTVGAVGGMIIGMITRTARGHTGLPLHVGPVEIVAYGLVHAAAVVRVFVPLLWPDTYRHAVMASGILWCAAFAAYLWTYLPILTAPRADGRDS